MENRQVSLKTGALSEEQVALLLNQIGLEVTFIDEEDRYRFFTDVPNPIFDRGAEIIGTHVLDCHPEATHEGIMTMLEEFRTGAKETESHWSKSKAKEGRRVLVTYRAIRGVNGEYRGCVEIVQDIEGLHG